MKILEPGRQQKGWSTEAKCTGNGNGGGGCGAKLLVEQADVFSITRRHFDDSDYFHTFQCGACGVWTNLAQLCPFNPQPRPR